MYTPYRAAMIVNSALEERGLPIIPPQMIYNYTSARLRKGQRPLIPCEVHDGKVLITADALTTWMRKYVAKREALASLAQPAVVSDDSPDGPDGD